VTTALANIFVAFIARINVFKGPSQFFFYGSLALAAGAMLWLVARNFKVRDYFQAAAPGPTGEATLTPPAARSA